VTVIEEQPSNETIELRDLGDAQLGLLVSAPDIDAKLRQTLGELAQRRQKISRQQAELDRLNGERTRLTEDEDRLRDNYTALKDDPGMRKSTLDKLKAADAAIDDNTGATAKANAALTAAQGDLAAFINSLRL
jgi:septal ring factor EnvC (AmiA/AmiB activator)